MTQGTTSWNLVRTGPHRQRPNTGRHYSPSNTSPSDLIYLEITGETQLFDLRSVLLLCGDSVTDTDDRFDVPIGYNNLENGISANEVPITHGQSLLCNVYKQISADSAFPRAAEFPAGAGLPPPKIPVVQRTDRFKNHRLICVPSASKCSVQTLSRLRFRSFSRKTFEKSSGTLSFAL